MRNDESKLRAVKLQAEQGASASEHDAPSFRGVRRALTQPASAFKGAAVPGVAPAEAAASPQLSRQ